MKDIINKYTEMNLVIRIVIGLIVGIAVALALRPFIITADGSEPAVIAGFMGGVVNAFGTLFVGALKGIAPILVFFLVATSLAKTKVGQGATLKRVLVLYIIGTVLAALLAVGMSNLIVVDMVFPKDTDLSSFAPPSGLGQVITNLLANVVTNPLASMANANYLGVLFWAVLTGIALRAWATEGLQKALVSISNALTCMVRWIIQFAPFGIMGLIYAAVIENGLNIFIDYGMLLIVLVGSMLAMFFIVNPLIVFLNTRQNPYPLVWKCISRSAITAFFTRSSAANIPVNMELCEELGLEEDNYSISIPLGATINMEGAAITITVMTLAACHTLGIEVDFVSSILLSILAAVGACGSSGVAGGSLLLIPMACSLFGIPADISAGVIGVGFIVGVIQDSMETALNSSTDALFTTTAEIAHNKKVGKPIPKGVPGMK
ncbi:MAG: serine/threonine transporter SstT [Eggerthellaceae bacterium]|nr:serine/threonine transporter SstT [Eggerthellaceae bacterium]